MNHTYRLVWNESSQSYVPAAEGTRARKKSGGCKALKRLSVVAASVGSLCFGNACADPTANLPTGGHIVAGDGNFAENGNTLTVQQNSQQLITDWQSFDIGAGHRVNFIQPGRDAVALNRVLGNDPSRIFGQLDANGRVFLVNTNGVLFGESAQVNVGGLVASTLNISNEDFLAGRYTLRGDGDNAYVINHGDITADGGAVALLGGTVGNHGLIHANLGSVALAAGNQVTLDFAGDGLIQLTVDEAALNALAENHQLIRADGGSVLLNAKATDVLLQTVVNNTGTIEARTLENREGRIVLLGGFEGGTVQVSGTLDASALPADTEQRANGGFIDTSGANVTIADGTRVTTLGSGGGAAGSWLIDPTDFTITAGSGAQTGSSIGADTLAANLANTNVELQTLDTGTDAGNIHVNAAVSWNAQTTLTLTAHNNIDINAPITVQHTGGGLALNHGGSGYYVRAPISFTAGSGGSFVVNGDAYNLIHTPDQLQAISGDLGGRHALATNIDASDTANWNGGLGFAPIGDFDNPFFGVLDGLGHVISQLTVDRPNQNRVGLFGDTRGTLNNIGLVDARIHGYILVGALAGYGGNISNSYATGGVTGYSNTGGLVGFHRDGTLSDAWFTGYVTSIYGAGGLVGAVQNGTVTRSYAAATLEGGILGGVEVGNLGGLVGDWYGGGGISASFHTGPDNGLGTRKTPAELQQLSTFTAAGWDIDDQGGTGATWRIYEGHTTPLLRSFLTPLTVTVNDNAGKVYDGVGSGNLDGQYTLSDSAASVDGSLLFNTSAANAGAYRVGDGSLVLNGLYSDQLGYDISYASASTYTIARREVSIAGVSAQDKVYDGTTAATVSGGILLGIVGADRDDVELMLGAAVFDNENAATGKTVFVSGSLSGSAASNYTLASNATTTADITPRTITGNITAADKVYDGTTTVTLSGTLTGAIDGDDLGFVTTGSFADKNAGTGKVVNVSGSLSGIDAANYTLTSNATTAANITQRAITGNITAADKVYDGTTAATLSSSLTGAIDGDDLSFVTTGSFADKNAGTGKLVNVSGSLSGNDAINYILDSNATTSADITRRAIAGNITAADKVYDGTTTVTLSGTLTGAIDGDDIGLTTSGSFADKNAGTGKVVNVSGSLSGIDAANYTLTSNATTAANITQRAITGNITAADKVYDGTTAATISSSLTGAIDGDDLSFVTTGSFADKNAGTGKLVNVSGSLSGNDASNYILDSNATTSADITRRAIAGNITAADKVYDGTTTVTLSGTLTGAIDGDDLGFVTTGSFDDKNAGAGKAVNVNGALSGIDAANYALSSNATTAANITRRAIAGNITAADKVYDGTTAATLSGTLTGAISGDDLGFVTTGSFDDKNAGTGKLVNVSGSLSGNDASNYILDSNATTSADITRRAIAGNITAADKIYDGTTAAMLSGTLTGAIDGDDLGFVTTGSFDDKNAGAGKAVNVSGALSGIDAANYTLASNATTAANITPRALTGNIIAADKVYDGTTTATLSGTLTGALDGDDIGLTTSGSFDDKNAGIDKVVTVSGSLSGNDASNYALASNTTTTANITSRALVLTATSDRRTYDGTTASSATVSIDGLVNADTITALSQSFDSNNAGQRTLAVNAGYAINDGNGGGNYSVTTNTATGTIDRASLTLTPSGLQRLYGVPFAFEGDEFEIGAGRLFASDRIDSVRLTSEGASLDAAPGSYAIQISDARGVGLNNYLINYADARSGLRVLGTADSMGALGDTFASLHERREPLEMPLETSPLIVVVDGGMRLPNELSSDEPARP